MINVIVKQVGLVIPSVRSYQLTPGQTYSIYGPAQPDLQHAVNLGLATATGELITDNSGGTVSSAVADVGASFSQAGLNAIHATILATINSLAGVNPVL